MSDFNTITNCADILLSLQCNFSKLVCDEIFGQDSNHLFEKWLFSDKNLLYFITRLDNCNQAKLFRYAYAYSNGALEKS